MVLIRSKSLSLGVWCNIFFLCSVTFLLVKTILVAREQSVAALSSCSRERPWKISGRKRPRGCCHASWQEQVSRMLNQHMTGVNQPGDQEILNKVLDGRVNDFELLVKRYRNYVFKVISGFFQQILCPILLMRSSSRPVRHYRALTDAPSFTNGSPL